MSTISALAASLSPGQWGNLNPGNMTPTFHNTGGNSNLLSGYASISVWDSVRHECHFIGSDHGNSDYRHLRYNPTTNGWESIGLPQWFTYGGTPETRLQMDSHGYHSTAIMVSRRRLYRAPYGDRDRVYVWNLDSPDSTTGWTSFTEYGSVGSGGVPSISGFPDRDSIIHDRSDFSTIEEYLLATGAVNTPSRANNIDFGSTFNVTEYSAVKQLVLCVSDDGAMGKYSAAGVFTYLSDLTVSIYDGSGSAGSIVAEPSGKFLIMADQASGRALYEYNIDTQVTTLVANQPPFLPLGGANNNCIPCAIDEYGVVMYTFCGSDGSNGAYLYKHAATASTGPSKIVFTIT
jgi:hypothetical protein